MEEIARENGLRILGMSPDAIEAGADEDDWDGFGPEPEAKVRFSGDDCNVLCDAVQKYWEREGIHPDVLGFDAATDAAVVAILREWANGQ